MKKQAELLVIVTGKIITVIASRNQVRLYKLTIKSQPTIEIAFSL